MVNLPNLPKPINFLMWFGVVGLAYDATVREGNQPWDGMDYLTVLLATWVIRKGASRAGVM